MKLDYVKYLRNYKTNNMKDDRLNAIALLFASQDVDVPVNDAFSELGEINRKFLFQ